MDLNGNFVITVSREVGSGGHTVAKLLAKELGVRFCDKQVMQKLKEEFGLSVYEIERIKAKKKNWFLDLFDAVAPVSRGEAYLESLPHPNALSVSPVEIMSSEADILKELAAEGPCVIAGRAAFAILDCPQKVDVFIRSAHENRIARIMKKQGVSEEQAEILMKSIDEGRENYVRRLCGRSRYDVRNYDLVINMDKLASEEDAVKIILDYVR